MTTIIVFSVNQDGFIWICVVLSTLHQFLSASSFPLYLGFAWNDKSLGTHCLESIDFSIQSQQEHIYKLLWQLSRHWRVHIWDQSLKNKLVHQGKQEAMEEGVLPGERSVQSDKDALDLVPQIQEQKASILKLWVVYTWLTSLLRNTMPVVFLILMENNYLDTL